MPQVFISYSHDDRYIAESIATDLIRDGYRAWIDVDGLIGGDVWERAIEKAIDAADALLVIVTVQALKSEWVKKEIAIARDKKTRIVPLIMSRLEIPADLIKIGVDDLQAVDFQTLGRERGYAALKRAIPGETPTPTPDALKGATISIEQHVEHGSATGIVINYGHHPDPVDAATRQKAYLRSWFMRPWANVSLADITTRNERVSLLDVYVPLPVDFGITVKTKDKQIIDWWCGRDNPGQGDIPSDKAARPDSLREWQSLNVGESALQQIVDGLGTKIRLRDYDDGEHYWYMEAHDAASVQPRMVLVGDAGSGKSSFVRHLALCLAGELLRGMGDDSVPSNAGLPALRDWLLGAYTPLYIELRDLVSRVFPALPSNDSPVEMPTIEHFWKYVREYVLGATLGNYVTDLRKRLEDGDAIVLLDGLDEIPDASDSRRREQVKALVKALDSYRKARSIVTSRPYAYRLGEWSLPGYWRCELRPLDMRRLQELAKALFQQILPAQAEAEANAFFEALESVPEDLRRSPLFFTLLAAIWLGSPGEHRLPETRGALYREALDLMLAKWTIRKGMSRSIADMLDLDEKQLRVVLEDVARQVHEMSDGSDTTEFHRSLLSDAILRIDDDLRPGRVWKHLEQRAGILVSGRDEHFRFAHRSFQEHLAACYLTTHDRVRLANIAVADRFPQGITERVLKNTDLWRNVARLAADELMYTDREPDVWRMLPRWFSPYLKDGSAAQAAILALDVAIEHGLPKIECDEFSAEQAVLNGLRNTVARLVIDLGLPAQQRAEIGRALAAIRDNRPYIGLRTDNGLPDIAWADEVQPGTYSIGETEQSDNPPREIEIKRPYRVSKYLITQVQYLAFQNDDSERGYTCAEWWEGLAASESDKRPAEPAFRYDNHPMERVNWYQAVAFCRWLTYRYLEAGLLPSPSGEGSGVRAEIRLPHEYEWEVAARGTDGRTYSYRGDFDPAKANTSETNIRQTSAVGIFPDGISPCGAFDMTGNVWEWCLNTYENQDNTDLTGTVSRALRGGSWLSYRDRARAAGRYYDLSGPDVRSSSLGFRAALVVPHLKGR